jgi:RNA polymerase sigma-70 factor (ECF subfamily)
LDFDTAFGTHYPALFRYLHRLTGDADRAADIAQESFVRLLDRSLPPEKVRGWLYTVATNLVRDDARTRDRRRRLLEARDVAPDAPTRPDERVERGERIAAVRGALDALPPRDRKLLLLREEGFRYAEIAQMAGVPPTSVGKMLARALARFARAYGVEEEETDGEDDERRDDDDGSSD